MKPLTQTNKKELMHRIEKGIGAELRSLSIIDPTTMQLRLSAQDKTRGFDWIDVIFEMSGVSDARLVEDSKLGFLDTEEGLTLAFEANEVILAVGDFGSFHSAHDAPLYLKGASLKYEEAPFLG